MDELESNPKPTAPTQPYQFIYIDDTVTVLPLTVQSQNFIRTIDRTDDTQMKLPDQISHYFQELIIDQGLEQTRLRLPDEAHKLVFEFLEMTPPPREHENVERAKDIRLKLATSKDKQKMLWEIQRQWCQPALRKMILANINNYDRRELMPSLCEEDTSSDEEDSCQKKNHNGLKPQQQYNPTYSQITMTSPMLVLTPKTKDKEEILQRIQIGIDKHKYCYL